MKSDLASHEKQGLLAFYFNNPYLLMKISVEINAFLFHPHGPLSVVLPTPRSWLGLAIPCSVDDPTLHPHLPAVLSSARQDPLVVWCLGFCLSAPGVFGSGSWISGRAFPVQAAESGQQRGVPYAGVMGCGTASLRDAASSSGGWLCALLAGHAGFGLERKEVQTGDCFRPRT